MRQAEGIGAPFRVALPTYGYRLHFDADGKYLGLSAENYSERFASAPQSRLLDSDATEVQSFLKRLRRGRSAHLEGLIWFRMPVEGDRMNWPWRTLNAVIAGETPAPRLVVHQEVQDEGRLVDVFVVNEGSAESRAPFSVRVACDPSRDLALDALGSFTGRQSGPEEVEFRSAPDRREDYSTRASSRAAN